MVCLGEGVYRLHGVPRMHERPQASLFQALRQLGYQTFLDQFPMVSRAQARGVLGASRDLLLTLEKNLKS